MPFRIVVLAALVAVMGSAAVQAEQLRPQARPAGLVPELSEDEIRALAQSIAEDVSEAPEPLPLENTVTTSAIGPVEAPDVGPETNLPLPRFVSLKAEEANVRRGPSLSHRIDWVFMRRGMPLQVIAEYGHWRRVTDREGVGGWIHYSLLSGARTVIVDEHMLMARMRPSEASPGVAQFELGVVARLGECQLHWCRINAGGYRGWVEKTALWGVGADELRD